MNAVRPQVHLEVLKVGPTSYEDDLDKCLILESYEVQEGVKTLRTHTNTSSGGKNKHATSEGVTNSRPPSLPDQLLDPITSSIKQLEKDYSKLFKA